jgi:hypothetical protein
MIMRSRPANIRLINRRSNLSRLLLALSSRKRKDNDKNIPTDFAEVDTVTPYQGLALNEWYGDLSTTDHGIVAYFRMADQLENETMPVADNATCRARPITGIAVS